MAPEFGGRQALEEALERYTLEVERKDKLGDKAKPVPPQVRPAMRREAAERMASDLEGYDGRIKGGRLQEAP